MIRSNKLFLQCNLFLKKLNKIVPTLTDFKIITWVKVRQLALVSPTFGSSHLHDEISLQFKTITNLNTEYINLIHSFWCSRCCSVCVAFNSCDPWGKCPVIWSISQRWAMSKAPPDSGMKRNHTMPVKTSSSPQGSTWTRSASGTPYAASTEQRGFR